MNDSSRAEDPRLRIDPAAAQALEQGAIGDPFALLGPHPTEGGVIVRAYVPGAQAVQAVRDGVVLAELTAVQIPHLFAAMLSDTGSYVLRIHWPTGVIEERSE